MTDELKERLGLLMDKCDNYLAATELQIPAHIHAEGLKGGMQEIREELQSILNQ